ncbi:MAG: hypothetical protein DHS20C10_13750 [marine bacterium B5-7]|nr:MAG: hypothetical protein DHS20C10_13750 [marine bacterium B5-7]
MTPLHIQVVTNAAQRPTAVLIAYEDWMAIQNKLSIETDYEVPAPRSINRYNGTLKLNQDPMHFQENMRGEW